MRTEVLGVLAECAQSIILQFKNPQHCGDDVQPWRTVVFVAFSTPCSHDSNNLGRESVKICAALADVEYR